MSKKKSRRKNAVRLELASRAMVSVGEVLRRQVSPAANTPKDHQQILRELGAFLKN